MAIHISEFKVDRYRGLKNIALKDLNHINIVTGKNNSGKTSVLELINTLNNPLWGESWFQAVYPRNAGMSVFSEMTRMLPFGEESISYEFTREGDETFHSVQLIGNVVDSLVTQRELMRLNGYIQTGSPKMENDIPYQMKQLQIRVSFDENERKALLVIARGG